MSVSIITLVHGREQHLHNLIIGLNQSNRLPDELLIIYMNEEDNYRLPATSFPIRQYHVSSSATRIPLALARNKGAKKAAGDYLIFLDVDCIPAATLIDDYVSAISQFSGLLMGTIRYLPPGSTQAAWSLPALHQLGVEHPNRPQVSFLWEACTRYELFWSLNFAIQKTDFERIGGFDTQYQGYGAEDTDFAFEARQHALPFALCQATCYHQHHPVYKPPLQHFQDIVTNARRFYIKWHHWPMEGWLQAFAERKLIEWHADTASLKIIRNPTEHEIKATHHEAPAGF